MSEPTPSIKQLCQALSRLIGVTEPAMIADLKTVNESEILLRAALDELAALRAQVAEQQQRRERVEAVLNEAAKERHLTVLVGAHGATMYRCIYCYHRWATHLPEAHEQDCATVQARTLLGEGGQ